MERITVSSKDGRDFIIEIDENEAYVGTVAILSDIAAQLLVHEAMKNSGLKRSGCFRMIETSDGVAVGVGFKIPGIVRVFGNPMKKIEASINNYNCSK